MSPADPPDDSEDLPVAPTVAAWRAMSPADRERFVLDAMDALQREADLAPEGRPHSVARASAASVLGEFFSRIGRRMYLATDLPVHYPGERVFCPDLLAVRDVEDPGHQDTRMAWIVADEGRGLDLVMEILHAGDRAKDLVVNVAFYARLAIPEYFVYDRRNQRLYGYRLPEGGGAYQSIAWRRGRLESSVLGLDLAILEGRLRFFYGDAVVPEARELIARLEAMLTERERQSSSDDADRVARSEARAAAAEARAADLEARLAALLAERDGG